MNKLEDLKECIERQYNNLEKSKYRPRSKEGIVTKRNLIKDFFKEFEDILSEFENKVSAQTWNKLTDVYEFVKTRVERALKILGGSSVVPDKKRFFNPPSGVIMPFSYHSLRRLDTRFLFSWKGRHFLVISLEPEVVTIFI